MKTLDLFKICALAFGIFWQATFAGPLSNNCIQEFAALPKTKVNFNLEEFLKGVPTEVVKVKAQMKLPFGKPADSKMTDIGITVGCLKQFPESAGAIAPMLKDLSLEITKNMVASGLIAAAGVQPNAAQPSAAQPNAVQSNAAITWLQNAPEKKAVESKDIIHLQNKQEIDNAIISEIGVDEVKYKIGTREIVYVVKKKDISSISYADGGKEFFCNGASYNQATHFCHTDGKTYSCGNKPYSPATQSCSNNIIYEKCNNKLYNIATHFCHTDGQTYSCNNKPYNPATHFCNGNMIYEKCGGNLYELATQFCFDNVVYAKCGNNLYHPATQICASDNNIYAKCGDEPYISETHFCVQNTIHEKCAGGLYDPTTQSCKESEKQDKSSSAGIFLATSFIVLTLLGLLTQL